MSQRPPASIGQRLEEVDTPALVLDLDACNGCGLCITACPEPYGLQPQVESFELEDPAKLFGRKHTEAPHPVDIADSVEPLPAVEGVMG